MAKGKHTPGPWVVETQKEIRLIVVGPVTGDTELDLICDMDLGAWGRGKREALANARLIAAAPELLEALRKMLAETELLADEVRGQLPELNYEARQAIARATGKKRKKVRSC